MGKTECYDVALLTAPNTEAHWPGYQRQRATFVDGALAEPIQWPALVSGEALVTGVALYQPGTDTVIETLRTDRSLCMFPMMSPRFEAGAIALPTEADIAREQNAMAELAKALRGEAFGAV